MLKKIVISIVILISMVLVFFTLRKPKEIKLHTHPQVYVSCEEEGKYTIKMYVNQKNTYLTDEEKLNKAFFSDANEESLIKLKCLSINYLGEVDINKERYYLFAYAFLEESGLDHMQILEAYLNISYYGDKSIKVFIGSVGHYVEATNFIPFMHIESMRGVVNVIDGKKTLVGIQLKISSEREIILKNISFCNPVIQTSDIKIVSNLFSSNEDISQHLGYKYKYNANMGQKWDIRIDDDIILISLQYDELYQVADLGFKLIFDIDDREYIHYIPLFHFFTDYERSVHIEELRTYHYEYD